MLYKIIKNEPKINFAWAQTVDLFPSMLTYPNALEFLHFPTNEKKYDELIFNNSSCPVAELAPIMPQINGRYILSVGAELGFYYGAEFKAAGVINVDLNPAVSHLWFPFLLYLAENGESHWEQKVLIEELFDYVKAYRVCQVPAKNKRAFVEETPFYYQEGENSTTLNARIEKAYQEYLAKRAVRIEKFQIIMEKKPDKLKRFFNEYCPPEKKEYLSILNNPTQQSNQGLLHSPLFSRPETWSFIKRVVETEKLWLIRGSIIEESTAEAIKKSVDSKDIGLIYLSNVLQVLEPAEKKLLATQIKQLNLEQDTWAISSTINKNYLFSLKEFIKTIE